ncbi:MAG: NUDIX hydrolase [Chloroflexota bacterium]
MPMTTAGAILHANQEGRTQVLLVLRNTPPFKGHWCLPGGHIDRFETAADAIRREVREETGLDCELAFFDYFDEIIPEMEIHAVVLVFEGTASGELSYPEEEISDARWFPLEEVRQLPLAFRHNAILDTYVQRRGF